jgi:hypothetical protein
MIPLETKTMGGMPRAGEPGAGGGSEEDGCPLQMMADVVRRTALFFNESNLIPESALCVQQMRLR